MKLTLHTAWVSLYLKQLVRYTFPGISISTHGMSRVPHMNFAFLWTKDLDSCRHTFDASSKNQKPFSLTSAKINYDFNGTSW